MAPESNSMIKAEECRLGNEVLFKSQHKISRVQLDFSHFELLSKGQAALFFPVVLKAEILEAFGFRENKDYPLAPQAREYKLTLPLPGKEHYELAAYIKSNGESFARAVLGSNPASINLYYLHQLQNLHFALTGTELKIIR